MRILHIALASHFTEGMLYQENVLLDINKKDGHDVTIITDTWHFEGDTLVKGIEEDRALENGIRLIRLDYDYIINDFITSKIQKCRKLKGYLEELQPEVILYHGVNGYEMMDVADYVKRNRDCKFYMDVHADFNTSAKTFNSKLFYQIIHGRYVRKAIPYVEKVFYIASEVKTWVKTIYGISDEKLEFLPLGGRIYNLEEQKQARQNIINRYALPQDAIILAHSGRLTEEKRTLDLLEAFKRVNDNRLALFIFGYIPKEMEGVIRPKLESDNRIHFMGWKVDKEIEEFLAGTDIYCQPGVMATTFETAMCCGCANMTYPWEAYTDSLYSDCNGENYFFVETVEDMEKVFADVCNNPMILEQTKAKSFAFAKLQFDYETIARRIYN